MGQCLAIFHDLRLRRRRPSSRGCRPTGPGKDADHADEINEGGAAVLMTPRFRRERSDEDSGERGNDAKPIQADDC
jgi:hypothetical protein